MKSLKIQFYNLTGIIKKTIIILGEDGLIIFIRRAIGKIKPTFFKINKTLITKEALSTRHLRSVYFVSNVNIGGSKKYITDLINTFESSSLNFVQLKNTSDLDMHKDFIKKGDLLIFQYLFKTNFTFEDIENIKVKYGMKLIIPIHDFYFLGKSMNDFYQFNRDVHLNYFNNPSFLPDVLSFLKRADVIIYPSDFVKNIYDSLFVFKNAHMSAHIDYKIIDHLNIPKVDKVINIGIINDVLFPKGASFYPKLFEINEYKGNTIIYHIFGHNEISSPNTIFHGPYVEEEIFSLLIKNNIHGLVFLNEYAETYSYSLTKGIIAGLPILYSNIGAYIERLKNNKNYFPLDSINNINLEMSKVFDVILNKQRKDSSKEIIDLEKNIPTFYQNLFSIDYDYVLNSQYKQNKYSYSKLFNFIEPYAIYFPQFHSLKEYTDTFYDGYHDMINLVKAKKNDTSIETPLKDYLGYYNLKTDPTIIEKQVLLAKANGIKGFGIYYYWFSHNSVTGNNMLMKDVVDKFFKKEINGFDVFFIYANESWSNNPAFNQNTNDYIIRNEYSEVQIIKNFENLLNYFKHKNYKKINNRPIFLIHHPWEMTNTELGLFCSIGDKFARKNGFDGIEFIINGISHHYEEYKNYSHSPNYKSSSIFTSFENGLRYIDYKKYVDDYLPNTNFRSLDVQSVFYNFNNTVRYLNHKNKDILITMTKNNSIDYFKKFLKLQFNSYKCEDKISKIFLLNSWNEWGEQMALEPSNESGFNLLDAFSSTFLEFLVENEQELNKSSFKKNLLEMANNNNDNL